MKKYRNTLVYLIFLGLGLFLFFEQYPLSKLGGIFKDMLHADLRWVGIAVVCALIAHLSRAARWNMLIKPLGYQPKLINSFYSLMFGYAANTLVPRLGEVSRCVLLNRAEKVPVAKLFGTVVIERIFDLMALALFVFITVVIEFDVIAQTLIDIVGQRSEGLKSAFKLEMLLLAIGVAVAGFFLIRLILKSKFGIKIKGLLIGFKEGITAVKKLKKVWLFIFHTLLIWVMYFFMAYVCFFAIPETSGLGLRAGLTTFVLASIGFIAPVPGGTGTYQFMFILALSLYGIPEEHSKITAMIAYSANTLFNLFAGGLSFVIVAFAHKKVSNEVTPTA